MTHEDLLFESEGNPDDQGVPIDIDAKIAAIAASGNMRDRSGVYAPAQGVQQELGGGVSATTEELDGVSAARIRKRDEARHEEHPDQIGPYQPLDKKYPGIGAPNARASRKILEAKKKKDDEAERKRVASLPQARERAVVEDARVLDFIKAAAKRKRNRGEGTDAQAEENL